MMPHTLLTVIKRQGGFTDRRVSARGGLENKQTGRIVKTALEVAVGNDRITRRYSGLAERLTATSSGQPAR